MIESLFKMDRTVRSVSQEDMPDQPPIAAILRLKKDLYTKAFKGYIENNEKELIYPYYRLMEEGYEVHLLGTQKDESYTGKSNLTQKSSHASKDVKASDYDAVVIPGGYSPDHMRRCEDTIQFVKQANALNKTIAAICHGPWMMVSCCDLKGKKLTSFYSIKDDLINAGAEYVDQAVVVDGNLITSRNPNDLVDFLKAIIKQVG